MKAGWELKDISDVTFIQEGPGIRKYEYQEDGYPMINVRCVQNGYIDMSNGRAANTELAKGKWKHFQIDEGDILFTISGTIGRCAMVEADDLPLLMNTSVVRFKSIDSQLDSRFLYLFLQSDGFQHPLKLLSGGTAIQNVGPTHIKTLSIPLPPLEEQKRIVSILDEAFEGLDRARENAEANLKSARELFERIMTKAFAAIKLCDSSNLKTVDEIRLPEKGSMRTGPFGSDLLTSEFTNEGIPVLGIDNAVTNQFKWGKRRFISQEKYDVLKRYTVKPKDVIITIMGTCGRCAVVPDDIPKAINTKHLCCITLNPEECIPDYLHAYFLHSEDATHYLTEEASGSVMDGLNMGIIKRLPVYLPPLDKQKEIGLFYKESKESFEDLSGHYTAKLQDISDLRQSLLQKAFAGQLT